MKIVTLIENTAETDKLLIENGISFYVEHRGINFLIDTGSSDKFIKNAERMKIDLKKLHFAVLSHNETPLSGGISALRKLNPTIKIFAQREAKNDYYSNSSVFSVQSGISSTVFNRYDENFILFNNFQEVADGTFLMTTEMYDEKYETSDKNTLIKINSKLKKDEFYADIFTVIFPSGTTPPIIGEHIEQNDKNGCIIIAPCARTGLPNIINTVRHNWHGVKILGIICGFHTMGKTPKHLNCSIDYLDNTAIAIANLNVGQIYATHCTGLKAYDYLREKLGTQFQYLRTGESLEF